MKQREQARVLLKKALQDEALLDEILDAAKKMPLKTLYKLEISPAAA